VSDTSADYDRDADALALSETGVYAPCEAPHLTEPDAWCDALATTSRTLPPATWANGPLLVCADHADALDRAASHASGAV
jgi:hypothetical protein